MSGSRSAFHGRTVAVLLAAAATQAAPAASQTAHVGPCDEPVPGRLATSSDLYCLELVASPGVDGPVGSVELRRPPGPFSVGLSAEGRQLYELVFHLEDLPDPSAFGDYSTYVAWVATPLLYPIERLGEVANGIAAVGRVEFDKFLILVSAERSADAEERTGPLVLRGQSPSSRMKPADFVEFFLGSARLEESPEGGHAHGGAGGSVWPAHTMPAGVTMLPALMRLRSELTPYLPAGDTAGPIPDVRPRELRRLSHGDTLDLEAGFVKRTIGGKTFVMYGFNGQHPGPLIWVPQDATITVNFTNRIDWPTTVHWHGVRLDNASDGVPGVTQEPVLPGETFTYTIHFRDAGIYWYHPHHREDIQQDLGLYGNMLVRSPRPDYFGPANREEVLMLDDILVGEEGIMPFGLESATHMLMGRFGNVFLVNGEPDHALAARRGEVVRFFLTNVSNTRTFHVSFGDAPMKIVGTDVGNFEREHRVDGVIIAPAERYVVHVRFPDSGEYPLLNRVRGIDHINGRYFGEVDTLAVVRVGAADVDLDLRAEFETLREDSYVIDELDGFRQHFDRPVDRRLVLDMEARDLPLVVDRLMQLDSAYFNPVEWSGTMPMMNWISSSEQVSWIVRDPDSGAENEAIDWNFRTGDIVKIRIANRREAFHAMHHPIHIHGQRFLILSQDGVPTRNLAWKDTAMVPVGSTMDILLELSNPGRWMLHCHIAEHLEAGMKTVFTVH